MTAWRQAIELSIGDEDVARLVTITRSRTEPASRVERARMLLAYREDPSFFAVAHALGVHYLQGNQSLARRSARRSLRIHLHSQARLVAQSRRGLLFQARAIRPAPHPCDIQKTRSSRLI